MSFLNRAVACLVCSEYSGIAAAHNSKAQSRMSMICLTWGMVVIVVCCSSISCMQSSAVYVPIMFKHATVSVSRTTRPHLPLVILDDSAVRQPN